MSNQGAVSVARNRNDDRFYNPPAVRRHKEQMLQKQQEEQQIRISSAPSISSSKTSGDDCLSTNSESKTNGDDCVSAISASKTSGDDCVSSISASSEVDCVTNLDQFLKFTTPFVKAQYSPKMSRRDLKKHSAEFHPYFVLGDLWESFKEWSVYGAGVPLTLNEDDSVVQYYVPYLSGIQLYIDSRLRRLSIESDAESSSREISSNGSSDYEGEKGLNNVSCELRSKLNLTGSKSSSKKSRSLGKEPITASMNGERDISNHPGQLMFEYLERDLPFSRKPLTDKISGLASQCPELTTYKSCDLLPSSWMSVSWYPIYRIPTGPMLQNLDACFLTFHSLSTPLKSACDDSVDPHSSNIKKLSLPIFGLAFYKFKLSIWNPSEVCQKANSLLLAAGNWLKSLQVNHPDYSFFVSHNSYMR